MTQMGSGRSDAYLFCDEAEAVVHETLFGKSKFFVVDLPVKEYDATAHKLTRKALLSPSSIFILQKDIADKYLALLLRDFKMALERTGAEEIDLRMHPDDRTDWYKKLIAYLNDHGVKIKMVGCEKPIREVIVDYVGMVGLSSCTLRDARVARKDIPVIGFEGASKFRFKNPIFVYSLSDGIDWILEDGSWRQTRKDVSYKKADKRPIREVIFSLLNEGAAR